MSQKIKLLHTSDWHLGKKLYKTDRIEEHEYILEQLYTTINQESIDILIIAGDIFDVISPANDIQKMFYDFIYKLGHETQVTTLIIPGNHDSISLFEIPKRFFELQRCHIVSRFQYDNFSNDFYYEKDGKVIGLKLLPYFRNYEIISFLEKYKLSVEELFDLFFSKWEREDIDYKILVAHHGFGKYSASGSEHAIYLSGLDYFPLEWVKDKFDYIALGHIHKRQTLSKSPPIVYPGSIIPLRFSESMNKYYSLIEIEDELSFNYKEFTQYRDIKSIKATRDNIFDIIQKLQNPFNTIGFCEVQINLENPENKLIDSIKTKLKEKNYELLSYQPIYSINKSHNENVNIYSLSTQELFKDFYKYKYDKNEVPEEILKSFQNLCNDINSEDNV